MSPALPVTTPKKVLQALKRAGFVIDHIKGSHYYLTHPDHPQRFVIIAMHASDLKRGTLASIIKQADMTVEDFIQIL